MRFKTFLVAAAMLAVPVIAQAGGFCCQLNTGVSEGLGGQASSGKFQVGVNYSYSRMEDFYEGDSHRSFASIMDDRRFFGVGMAVIPENMDMHRTTLSGSYAVNDRFRVVASVPWVINNMSMRMFMGGTWRRMTMQEVSGLGDATLTGLYRIYQDRDTMPQTILTAGVGLKFPTGSATVSEGGKRVHAHMQPGTGSWDPMLSLLFVKMLSSDFLLRADMTYHFTTENPLGYEFGDTAAVNAHLDYNLLDSVNLSLGANYFHSEQADDRENNYNGKVRRRMTDFAGYTGEDSFWIAPGIQILPFDGASIDVNMQVPVYYHVKGVQQVTDFRVNAGVSYGF